MKIIFRFVILSDEKESFVREIELHHNHTFLDLHKAIQVACDYDQTQMASFFIVDDDWCKEQELTLENMEGGSGITSMSYMGNVLLKDAIKYKRQKLLYIFDFFTERVLYIYLRDMYPARSGDLLPRMVSSRGKAPKQLVTGEEYIDNLLNDFSMN